MTMLAAGKERPLSEARKLKGLKALLSVKRRAKWGRSPGMTPGTFAAFQSMAGKSRWQPGKTGTKIKEANAMENPVYRITVEVIGDEKDHEIGNSLRGGG